MKRNGFLLLQSIAVITMGSLFLLTALRTYSECLLTMQKKLTLERALAMTQQPQENIPNLSTSTKEVETSVAGLVLEEVQVIKNAKPIFSLAQAK